MKFVLAQAIGIAALITAVIGFQQKEHKNIMLCQSISSALFTIHFFLLGAYTGSVLNFLSLIRSFVYYIYDNLNKNKFAALPYIFCFMFAVATAFTWEGFISLLPLAGCFVYTISFNMKSPRNVRIFSTLSSPFWLVYNFISGSYPGIITELIALGGIAVGYFRLDRKYKKL